MSTFNELIDFTRSTTGTYLDSVVYGDELVTNGDFSSGTTGWTNYSPSTTAFIETGGQLQITASGGNARVRSVLVSLVVGKTYKFTVTCTQKSNDGASFVHLGKSDTFGSYYVTNLGLNEPVGTYTYEFTAVGTELWIQLGAKTSSNTVSYDNVSVKEVTGGQVSGTPLLRTAAINEPRLEYDASGNPLGLLIEEARTNLFRYSQALSNVDHNLITTDNATVSPDGTQNASLCIPTSANVEHFIDDQNVISGTDYAISCFAKYGSGSHLLSFRGASIGGDAPQFNLQTGTVVNEGASSVWSNTKIEEVGNGWYKCSSVGNPNSASPLRFQIIRSDAVPNFIGDGTGHYIWGAQVETGAFPTSYIPTSGSTVTRAADVASLPVERFAYNQPQGSIVVAANRFSNAATFPSVFQIDDSTDGNRHTVEIRNTAGTVFGSTVFSSSTQAGLGSAAVGDSLAKLGYAYKSNDFSFSNNGSAALTDSSGTVPTVSSALIGSRRTSGASQYLNGHIKQIQYYPKRLSNTELQLLTQPSASPTMNLTFDGQATSTLVEGLHD